LIFLIFCFVEEKSFEKKHERKKKERKE